jgi:membrane associated rhomboid family serine protease
MLNPTPSELTIAGVYLPPALAIALFGLVAAWALAKILDRTRLARFFWNPPLAFLAIWVLMSAIIGLLVLPP